MAPDVREKVRKLRGKLCSLAEEYKGVRPEMCSHCQSPCAYGMELLSALGMERPEQEARKKETFNPIRREMLNSVHIEDEWDKYAKPMITKNEAREMAGYPQTKVILYADNKVYEYDSGVDMWQCRYCGGIRVGEKCKGCGAPRTQEG